MPALSIASSASTSSGRTPLVGRSSTLARSSMTARTTPAGSGVPTPAAWLRIRLTWRLLELVGRDADVGELAEAGVDPVDRLPRRDGPLDQPPARDQRVARVGIEPGARPGLAGDAHHIARW